MHCLVVYSKFFFEMVGNILILSSRSCDTSDKVVHCTSRLPCFLISSVHKVLFCPVMSKSFDLINRAIFNWCVLFKEGFFLVLLLTLAQKCMQI